MAGENFAPKILITQPFVSAPNDPMATEDSTGFLDSLFAEMQQSTRVTEIDRGDGHVDTVRIATKYRSFANDGYSQENTNACDATFNTRDWLEEEITVDPTKRVTYGVKVQESTVRNFLSGYSQLVTLAGGEQNLIRFAQGGAQGAAALRAQNGQNYMNAINLMNELFMDMQAGKNGLRGKIEQQLLTDMITKFGAYRDGSESKVFQFNNDPNDSVNFRGHLDLIEEFKIKAKSKGKPIVVGQGNIWRANASLGFAVANDSGINLGEMNPNEGGTEPWRFYYSDFVDEIFGGTAGENFFFYGAGSVVPVFFNKNKGSFGSKVDNRMRITAPDGRIPNLEYDVDIFETACGDSGDAEYDLAFGVNAQLYALPEATSYKPESSDGALDNDPLGAKFDTGVLGKGVNHTFRATCTVAPV